MNWIEVLEKRIKAKRQILFQKDDEFIQELLLLINQQSRQTVILWALDLAEETVILLEQKYPADIRARQALEMTKLWACGEIKMPVAKKAILACHAAAKELSSLEDIAHYHAVGQACGTVHANGHAIGYPIYDLTSIIRKYGIENCKEPIENRKSYYIDKLLYWKEHHMEFPGNWASFLQ
ncbi:MAG: hypothetical protein HDR20_03795 [Lachnospiraceae bacterium]|nr:hypothetical protein [Lachnospiraceae bacterium]